MHLAGAARQGDRHDASVVGPNENNNDSQNDVSNSVSTQGWQARLGERIIITTRRSQPNSAAGHTCKASATARPRADESVS